LDGLRGFSGTLAKFVGLSEKDGGSKRVDVHKNTATLQLLELCIGIIEDLIFEVTRKGIGTLVLVF